MLSRSGVEDPIVSFRRRACWSCLIREASAVRWGQCRKYRLNRSESSTQESVLMQIVQDHS